MTLEIAQELVSFAGKFMGILALIGAVRSEDQEQTRLLAWSILYFTLGTS